MGSTQLALALAWEESTHSVFGILPWAVHETTRGPLHSWDMVPVTST
jgi:hypothetical protein